MKLIFVIFTFVSILFSANISWAKNYNDAVLKAKKENKIVLAIVTTQACPWCIKFKNETLTDANIVNKVNSKFVAVHIDRDKDKYPRELNAKLVPTTYFINPKTDEKIQAIGYWIVEDFNGYLDDAIKRYK